MPDDPFAEPSDNDPDRTIIRPAKPVPGGRRTAEAAPVIPPRPVPVALPNRQGLNPLENAAAELLALITRLKNTPTHPDIEGLRRQLIEGIRTFESKARSQGISEITVTRARYMLCTVLDEMVASTPWGSGVWRNQTLLSTFHGERWGGDKVFLLLDSLIQDPSGNINLLELMYICLAFGFEGKYRVLNDGRTQLEWERERLFRAIRNHRGDFERELSPHWRGLVNYRNPLIRYVPLWVILAVASLLLLGLYGGFSLLLNRTSDPVYVALGDIRGDTVAMVERVTPLPAVQAPRQPPPVNAGPSVTDQFRNALAPEIRLGQVKVIADGDKTVLRILGDGLFDSGQAEVKPAFRPLLQRIADQMRTVPGRVLVTGHTDSIPIRTLRFPSNFHLSKARAEAVAQILINDTGATGRFYVEGRGETEPVAPNDTPQNRALNRRVDVILLNRGQ
ncbi:MAG: type VI secretion system protein TssL [Gammaproteobacteria bacterium]|nr:type VI secretion system protein TssL [Gammaproteobacteria bacterium]MCP5425223.1 type VI secretion system protein TssL [Gammaproteobacteria bacterium]MCP5459623.1 type VI secretion system protein TssL [Gammaproteobacteria bacterium]